MANKYLLVRLTPTQPVDASSFRAALQTISVTAFDKTVNKYLTPKGHKLYDIAHEKCWAEYMLASFEKDVLTGPPDGYFNITNPLDQPDVNSILAKSNLLTVAAKSAPRQPMWLTGSLEDEAVRGRR